MIVDLLRENEISSYGTFVNQTSESKIYHTLSWKKVIEDSYGYKPYYIVARHGDSIKGVLPLFEVRSAIFGNRLVSLPFSHFVNVLYSGDVEILGALLDFTKKLTKDLGSNYCQIKHGHPLPNDFDLRSSKQFMNAVLDLSQDIDTVWSNFESKSIKWGINRANKSGVEISKGTTLSDFRKFYELELETRKSQGAPVYPFDFFSNLYKNFDASEVRLYLAYLGEVYIAGIVVLCYNRQAIYGYGASRKDREYLKTRPNNLLLWTAIEELYNEGFQEFDFGTTPLNNTGLLKFKSQWGTKIYKIPYYYSLNKTEEVPVIDRDSGKIRLVNAILRKMPVSVLEKVGPLLLRQVG